MAEQDPERATPAFVAAINSHDPDAIAALTTEGHLFIDTEGGRGEGRETMREGWRGYYSLFPDYAVTVERSFVRDDGIVVLIGSSAGTMSAEGLASLRRDDGTPAQQGDFQGPAIWTAVVHDGLVAEWRVYEDTPEVRAEVAPE